MLESFITIHSHSKIYNIIFLFPWNHVYFFGTFKKNTILPLSFPVIYNIISKKEEIVLGIKWYLPRVNIPGKSFVFLYHFLSSVWDRVNLSCTIKSQKIEVKSVKNNLKHNIILIRNLEFSRSRKDKGFVRYERKRRQLSFRTYK